MIPNTPNNKDMYKRAGVLEPQERAFRDLNGGRLWIRHMLKILNFEYDYGIIIQCCRNNIISRRKLKSNWVVLDVNNQWFDENDVVGETETNVMFSPMNNLKKVVEKLKDIMKMFSQRAGKNEASIPVVFDSIVPLLLCHGLSSTNQFIEILSKLELSSKISPIVLPVSIESTSLHNHQILEDSSDAILTVNQGNLELFRKSRRGTGKVMREIIPFTIQDSQLNYLTESKPTLSSTEDDLDVLNDTNIFNKTNSNSNPGSKSMFLQIDEGKRKK